MGQDEETVRLNLRLPASLHRDLQEQAKENNRSLNSEIVTSLATAITAARFLAEARQQGELDGTNPVITNELIKLARDIQRVHQEVEESRSETRRLMEEIRGSEEKKDRKLT
jgi:hypothetical protein